MEEVQYKYLTSEEMTTIFEHIVKDAEAEHFRACVDLQVFHSKVNEQRVSNASGRLHRLYKLIDPPETSAGEGDFPPDPEADSPADPTSPTEEEGEDE